MTCIIKSIVYKETSRVDGTMMITFPAVKHEVHSSIKPGTSASSVSSYGSFSYRVIFCS